MIKISKNKEPKAWTSYRNTPGADYQAIPELVDSLLEEQGYICAYCMRRIPHKDRLYKKDGINFSFTDEDHRIEHILSRENHPDKKLRYDNMVICCPGHIGEEPHCDRLKGANDISSSPLRDDCIATISYRTDGTIVSSNSQYDDEINRVLNLNTPLLKRNRKESWKAVLKAILKEQKGKPLTPSILARHMQKYRSKHCKKDKMMYIPYCGIVAYFLQKKIKQWA